jgi:alkylation response protein AidB-like acyl-CoA dehydrogenase
MVVLTNFGTQKMVMFQLNEEHLMIQKAARDFAQNECLPGVIERDDKQKFPHEQVMKLGELGFLGMMVDPKWFGRIWNRGTKTKIPGAPCSW